MDNNVINIIIDSFQNEDLQSKLRNQRDDIECQLDEILESYNSDDGLKNKIKAKSVSRIKTSGSLFEKIKRQNYLSGRMEISNSDDAIDFLKKNLNDLIGFRVNCYFKIDEEIVFNRLVEDLRNNNFQVVIDRKPQKNGHEICKMHCFKPEYDFKFEIQVKSLLHEVWGEVEHRLIYKAREYDTSSDLQENIIKGLWKILEGTDEQLFQMSKKRVEKDKTKKELFYIITSEGKNDEILAKHYSNFFELTKNVHDFIDSLDDYLGYCLLKQDSFKPKNIKAPLNKYVGLIMENVDTYKLEKVCEIAKKIYDFDESNQFISFLLNEILLKTDDDTLSGDDFGDTFVDTITNESSEEEKKERDFLNKFESILLEKKAKEIEDLSIKG